jgi:hypothetical protein
VDEDAVGGAHVQAQRRPHEHAPEQHVAVLPRHVLPEHRAADRVAVLRHAAAERAG